MAEADDGAALSPLVLATRLAKHWEARGQFVAGRETLEGALATPGSSSAELAAAYGAIATLAMAQGDLDAARRGHEAALAHHVEAGDEGSAAATRVALATVFLRLGERDEARIHCEEALAVYARLGDPRGQAFAHSGLGIIASSSSAAQAADHLVESVQLLRAAGARREAAAVLANLGNLMSDSGDTQRSVRFFDGALQLFDEVGDARGAALVANNLSLLARARGDLDHALELAERARAMFAEAHDVHGEAATLNNIAGLYEEQGATADAARLYDAAIELFRRSGDEANLAIAEHNRSMLRPPSSELSPREEQVSALVASGFSNKEIAARLFISQRTVDSHLSHIFTKLGLASRTQLALWAADRGLGER